MNTKYLIFLLLFIYIITVIPTIIVYFEHATVEYNGYNEKKKLDNNIYKALKPLSESILFFAIGIGYIIVTIFMFLFPYNRIPYLVLLIGTVAVNILYWFRLYGIPIPLTEIVITDLSSDWRDVVTKICQQILVIPVSMLLILRMRINRN